MLPAVSKACVLQTPVKAMLWERKVAEQLSCQVGEDPAGARSKMLSKSLRGKAQALAVQAWSKEMQVKISNSKHGVSRAEALAALEPAVGGKMCADPGLLAVKRFLQGHRELLAIKVNEHHPFCTPWSLTSLSPRCREKQSLSYTQCRPVPGMWHAVKHSCCS